MIDGIVFFMFIVLGLVEFFESVGLQLSKNLESFHTVNSSDSFSIFLSLFSLGTPITGILGCLKLFHSSLMLHSFYPPVFIFLSVICFGQFVLLFLQVHQSFLLQGLLCCYFQHTFYLNIRVSVSASSIWVFFYIFHVST